MAEELPWFKFSPTEWLTSEIQICSHEQKGIFIEICCYYWSKLGDIKYRFAVQKVCNGDSELIDDMIDQGILKIKGDMISISFLDEQLKLRKNVSKKMADLAQKRWSKNNKAGSLKEDNLRSTENASAMHGAERSAMLKEKKRKEKKREEKRTTSEDVVVEHVSDVSVRENLALFEFWQSLGFQPKTKFKKEWDKHIKKLLYDYSLEEIKAATTNYHTALVDQEFYFQHQFSFIDFIKWRPQKAKFEIGEWMEDGNMWQNYVVWKHKNRPKTEAERLAEIMNHEDMENPPF